MTDNGTNNVGIDDENIILEGLKDDNILEGLKYDNILEIMKKIDEDPNNILIQTGKGKGSDEQPKTIFLVNNGKDKLQRGQVICEDLKKINTEKYKNTKLELVDKPNGDCGQTVKLQEQPIHTENNENKTPTFSEQIKNYVFAKKTEKSEPKPKAENKNWFAKSMSGLRKRLGYTDEEDDDKSQDNSFSSIISQGGGKYKKQSTYNTNKKTYKKRDKFGRFIGKKSRRYRK